MLFGRPVPHNRARLNEFADVSVRSVEIGTLDGSPSTLTARYVLQSRSRDDRRPLRIDFTYCPLWPVSIRSSVAKGVDIDATQADFSNVIAVSLDASSEASWHGAELTISFRWEGEPFHAPPVNAAFLYLPEELPLLGTQHARPEEAQEWPSVRIVSALQRVVAAAVPCAVREAAQPEGPFLQAVLTRQSRIECGADDGGSATVSVITTTLTEPTRVVEVCRKIREISEFFGTQLGPIAGLRLAAAVDPVEEERAMDGALVTAPLSWYPSPADEHGGHPFPIARMVAENWWGVGCRIHGARGMHLEGAIAFAMGLQWAETNTPRIYFAALLAAYRERLVKNSVFTRTVPKPGELTVGYGLVIYDGLSARRCMWQCLGPLTSLYWARSAPEEAVLKALVAAGVDVRDFRRKRFVRPPRQA